jgi:cellulose synthase/poly-beta-1,6-N-acetylglucosamine synthase-like glycosyltransferase
VSHTLQKFLASVYVPRKALLVGLAVLLAIAGAVAAGRRLVLHPVDVGPLCRICEAFPHGAKPLTQLPAIHHEAALPRPVNLSWLFYVNFVLVYALQIAPVLLFALWARRDGPAPRHRPAVRFLCLIPAHNEERVIANSVGSLMRQAYPRDLFEVCVISDGSTDGTDEIARRLGARVLRTPTAGAGKSKALAFAFERLLDGEDTGRDHIRPAEIVRRRPRGGASDEACARRYVCVIDADNRVAPDFLREMNNAIREHGYPCLQGFHDVLNGPANWITKSQWLNAIASSVLYNPGRFHSLGTALICGTGWCCEAALLRRYWSHVGTQTEDIELTGILLLRERIGVAWVAGAHVYDEKPLALWTAIRQRQRWMTGHMRVAGRLFWPLVVEGVRTRDIRMLELAAYYLLPFAMNAGNIQMLVLLGMNVGLLAVQGPFGWSVWQWGVTLTTLLYVFVYQIVGFGLETRLWWPAVLYSVYCAVFSFLAWAPALIWACFTVWRSDWIFHTPHVAAAAPVAEERLRAT